jgi:hypothetical protein
MFAWNYLPAVRVLATSFTAYHPHGRTAVDERVGEMVESPVAERLDVLYTPMDDVDAESHTSARPAGKAPSSRQRSRGAPAQYLAGS